MADPRLPAARAGRDRVVLRLSGPERRLLAMLLEELRGQLGDPAAAAPGGSLARLFPVAFPDDDRAQAAWDDLVRHDLVEGRLARVEAMAATLEARTLDDASAEAWLGVLNDLRLALGDRLGVTDEDDQAGAPGNPDDADDPDVMRRAVYLWLGWLVACLVDALEVTLPETPDEAADTDAPGPRPASLGDDRRPDDTDRPAGRR